MAQIKGVSITATTVKELKATIDELRGALLQLSKADEQYDEKVQQLQAHQAKLNEVMALTSKATMQEKQAISAVAGSYDELVAKAAQLRKEWRAMEIGTPQWTKQAEEINNITTQLKDADAAIGNHQRKVGDYTGGVIDAFAQLRGEIKKYKAELLQAEEGSEEYEQALAKLGEAQFRMKDMTEQAKYAVADVGEVLGAVSKTAQGVVGGFNAMQGVMALAGGESENLQKVMVKLQAGMAIVQGLQGLEGMIDSVKGLQIVLNGGIRRVVAFAKSLSTMKLALAGLGAVGAIGGIIALINKFSKANEVAEKSTETIERFERQYQHLQAVLKDKEIIGDIFDAKKLQDFAEKVSKSYGDINKIIGALFSLRYNANNPNTSVLDAQIAELNKFIVEQENFLDQLINGEESGKKNLEAIDRINKGIGDAIDERTRLLIERAKVGGNAVVKEVEQIGKINDKLYYALVNNRPYAKELDDLRKEWADATLLYIQYGLNTDLIDEYYEKKIAEIQEKIKEASERIARYAAERTAKNQEAFWAEVNEAMEKAREKTREEVDQAADFIEREAQATEDELTSWADTYLKGVDAERQGIEKNIEAVKQGEAEKLRYANISKSTEKERAKAIYDIKQQSLFDEAALLRQGLESGVLYGEQRVEAEERIAQIERDIAYNTAEYKIEQNQRAASTIVRVLSSSANAMGNILGSIADMYEQEGEANQEAMEKAKNLRIAGATMDMLGGVVAALSGLFTDKSGPWDFILAGIQAASILASGIANISKIKQTDVSGKTSGGTSGTSAIVSAPAIVQQVPITRTLTGVAEEERLNQASRVYVVYDDIAQVGRKVEVTETETTF